jgi:glucosamine kinase
MSFYLGIDGGGTKTTCAVADDSSILATAVAGPSNVVRVGEAKARESLQQAVRQACAAAGVTPAQVSATCIGASGAARPETAAVVQSALAEILLSPVDVKADTEISLEAAFSSGPGVIVIAGTGSIAYGRNTHEKTARAGGWGFAISDEGSAHWIGRIAIAALLRETVLESRNLDFSETSAESALLRAFLHAWDLKSIDDLIRAANATPSPDFSALFPAVVASADAGDATAQQVLTEAGKELASIADVVIRRLFSEATSYSESESVVAATRVRLAMIGGVFRHAALVREVFYNQIHGRHANVDLNPKVVDPVDGAISLARKAAQRSIAAKK